MAISIERQIITNISTRMQRIRTTAGYNYDLGSGISEGALRIDPDSLPAVILFPEYADNDIDQGTTYDWHNMQFGVEALHTFNPATETTVDVAQKMKADIYECLMSNIWYVDFALGAGLTAFVDNDSLLNGTLTTFAGTLTGKIDNYSITSGDFGTNDAAGQLKLRQFQVENTYVPGIATVADDIATITTTTTHSGLAGISAAHNISGSLAEEIYYEGGGVLQWPDAGQAVVQVRMDFRIRFKTLTGNPYSQ